jgi:drug/metabolite transporter (DMT)-like permease
LIRHRIGIAMGIDQTRHSPVRLVLAFAAIYLIWGSTYLAIRIAVETLPPFLMAGVRFLVAGTTLYLVGVRHGTPRPTKRHWRNAAIAGIPLFVIGNGGVTWAEQSVPSGLAALVVATLPAWLLLLDWASGGRTGPRLVEVLGIGLGLTGVAVLAAPSGTDGISLIGIVVLVASAVAWAAGSLFSRHADLPASPVRTAGMQMLAGGACMVAVGLVAGEGNRLIVDSVSLASVVAFIYLVVAAVIVLPAYQWLLTVTSPALIGTYAFVNPVVAVFLGWAAAQEELNGRTGIAVALVVGGVALLTWPRRSTLRRSGRTDTRLGRG